MLFPKETGRGAQLEIWGYKHFERDNSSSASPLLPCTVDARGQIALVLLNAFLLQPQNFDHWR